MNRQNGMTIIDLLLVIGVAAIVLGLASAWAVPTLAREGMRGAVYDVQTFMQLARIEAVSRNRDTRFVIDTAARSLQVFDTMGTVSTSDDISIHQRALPTTIAFAHPSSGSAVTLSALGGSVFQAVFGSNGTVVSGTGDVVLFGGNHYRRVSLFGAGGVRVQHWSGSDWDAGS